MTDVLIRRLAPGDEARAIEIARAFKRAALSAERARAFLANPAHHVIVAEVGGGLAGFVLAYRLERIDRETAQLFVYEVDVEARFRGEGVGTRLMEHVRRLVAEERLMEAFVLTDADNEAANRLYRGTGAVVEGATNVLFVYPGPTA